VGTSRKYVTTARNGEAEEYATREELERAVIGIKTLGPLVLMAYLRKYGK
jgi:hypothetical protein